MFNIPNKKIFSLLFIFLLPVCFFCGNKTETQNWQPLFNGKDLSNWKHYLAKPDKSFNVPGLKRDSSGAYIQPIGYMSSDPLNVFSVAELEGEPVIRISGQVIGNLFTDREYKNYHLQLKFKWGHIKWDRMRGRPRDGGILYHYRRTASGFSYRHEFQIHEGDVGSYWARHTIIDIPAVWTSGIPASILQAKPFLIHLVPTLKDTMLIHKAGAPLYSFQGKDEWQICIASPMNEKPAGQWNLLELICYENNAVHIVNGKVCLTVLNARVKADDSEIPIDRGTIQLQSEGAEIYFKDIFIRDIVDVPLKYDKYFQAGQL